MGCIWPTFKDSKETGFERTDTLPNLKRLENFIQETLKIDVNGNLILHFF